MSSVPDRIDPIRGWRAWSLYTPRWHVEPSRLKGAPLDWHHELGTMSALQPEWQLNSIYTAYHTRDTRPIHLWPVTRPMQATCRFCGCAQIGSCSCGLYAYKHPSPLRDLGWRMDSEVASVIGQVAGWGHVVEHQHGWRATYAYPSSLKLLCGTCLMWYEKLRESTKVVVLIDERARASAACEEHARQLIRKRKNDCRVRRTFPASKVEAQLLSRYRVPGESSFTFDPPNYNYTSRFLKWK